MEFYKPAALGLTLMISLLGVAGCSDNSHGEAPNGINFEQKRVLLEEAEFELPGQDNNIPTRFYAPSKAAWVGPIAKEPFELKKGKWQVWYTGNVWSDSYERESAAQRNKMIGLVLRRVNEFKKMNKLDFEVNFLQTDAISTDLGLPYSEATHGWSMHSGGGDCPPFFTYCVTNFVVAPFNAYGMTEPAAQYEWLRPYADVTKDRAEIMTSAHKGYADKNSKYWTMTPSSAFIVNPGGDVVDAFIPMVNDSQPSSGNIISALIREMEIDPDGLVYPTEWGSFYADQPDKLVYFGGDYTETFLNDLSEALK